MLYVLQELWSTFTPTCLLLEVFGYLILQGLLQEQSIVGESEAKSKIKKYTIPEFEVRSKLRPSF